MSVDECSKLSSISYLNKSNRRRRPLNIHYEGFYTFQQWWLSFVQRSLLRAFHSLTEDLPTLSQQRNGTVKTGARFVASRGRLNFASFSQHECNMHYFVLLTKKNEKLRFSNPENFRNKILTTFKQYKSRKLMISFKRSHFILDEADESPKPIKNLDTKYLG